MYFNYKGTFLLVLMALVDADYRFIYVDIGDYGSNADGSIFKNSWFGQAFSNGQLDLLLSSYPISQKVGNYHTVLWQMKHFL